MGGLHPFSKVLLNPVVVEERVVDIEQKDGAGREFIAMSPLANRPRALRAPQGSRRADGAPTAGQTLTVEAR